MKGFEYIAQTREYLNYLEKHLTNIYSAFEEISKACHDLPVIADDKSWSELKEEVLKHDLSKFSAEEFTQYRAAFYPVEIEKIDHMVAYEMKLAWDHHKKRNLHHWQSLLNGVDVQDQPGLVEQRTILMVIDWLAMSYEFGNTPREYYENNKKEIHLHSKVKEFLFIIFDRLEEYEHINNKTN